MAVSSPGRKLQLTRLTATWPPKRMVRSRVSSKVIRAFTPCRTSTAAHSDVMRGLDPRIHPASKMLLFRSGMDCRGKPGNDGSNIEDARTTPASQFPLVADRDVHVLDLEFAHRLQHGPGHIRIDLDLEVIHALQRLMVFLAEHHLALGAIE